MVTVYMCIQIWLCINKNVLYVNSTKNIDCGFAGIVLFPIFARFSIRKPVNVQVMLFNKSRVE